MEQFDFHIIWNKTPGILYFFKTKVTQLRETSSFFLLTFASNIYIITTNPQWSELLQPQSKWMSIPKMEFKHNFALSLPDALAYIT